MIPDYNLLQFHPLLGFCVLQNQVSYLRKHPSLGEVSTDSVSLQIVFSATFNVQSFVFINEQLCCTKKCLKTSAFIRIICVTYTDSLLNTTVVIVAAPWR